MKKIRKVFLLLFCFFAFFLFNMNVAHADSTPVYWTVSGSPITTASGFTKVAFEDTSQVHTTISSYTYYKDATCDSFITPSYQFCDTNSVPLENHVMIYISSNTLYIQFKGTLYLNENSTSLFSGLSQGNVTQITGLEYVNTSNVKSMEKMFYANRKLTSLDLSHFDTSQVTNMKDMFGYMSTITTLDVSMFDTSNVTNMEGMFQTLKSLTTLKFFDNNNITHFSTANVTNMANMFAGCNSLTSLDLTFFSTANVENMSYMFCEMSDLTSLNISSFNTSNVTDMSYMFAKMSSMTSIPITYLTTGSVTTMEGMFQDLTSITSLDISSFNTYNLENMSHMFQGDTALTSLNLSGLYTNMVENYESMFENVTSLTTLDVSGFNTIGAENMSRMFYNMTSLTSLSVANFNTSNVTDMSYMFYNLIGISSLNVSNFNTRYVTNMEGMFSKLLISTLDVLNFNTSNVTNMKRMFEGMPNIQVLDLSSFNTRYVTNMQEMFANNTSLETIYASSTWTTSRISSSGGGNIFMGDVNLKVAYGDPRDPYQTTYSAEKVDKRYAIIDSFNTEGYLSVHWSISSSVYEILYYDDYDFDQPDMKVDALQNYFDTSNITFNNVTPYYNSTEEYLYVVYNNLNIRRFKVVKPILDIDISQGDISIIRGRTRQLSVDFDPADTTYDRTITWESDDTSLLTVDADGTIHALQKGTVHVTATSIDGRVIANPYTGETDDSKQDTIEIEIYIPVDTFEFKDETTVDYQGDDVVAIIPRGHGEINPFDHYSFQKPTLEPHDTVVDPLDDTTESTNITWTSGDTSIVTVDQNGTITGVSPGHTTITASLDSNARYLVPNTDDEIQTGYSISYDVWVYIPIDTFTIEPSYRLYYDDYEYNHHQLTEVRQSDTYDHYEEPGTITWSSSDPTVVTIDQNGNITGLNKEGTSTITATIPKGWSRTSTVDVKILATGLTLSINGEEQTVSDTKTLEWKEFFTYETTIAPSNSSYTNITWASSDTNVATVDSNGKVTATGAGDAVITATLHNADNEGLARDLNIYESRNIHVLRPITTFTTALDPNRSTLYLGDPENEYDRAQLIPTYNNGNPYDVSGALTHTLTNNRLTIEEINSQTHTAQIIAVSKGSENIHTKVDHYPTSFDDSVYETDTALTIKQLATSFAITNQAANETKELEWKDTFTYTTSYLPATSDYTNVTWASSDDTIVSVDANGTITAVAPGTVTITATLHNADNEGLERDLNFYETRTVKVPIPITTFTTALNPNRNTLYLGDPENEYDRAQLIPTYNNGSSYEVPGNLTHTPANGRVTVTETSSQTHTAQIIAVSKGQETIHTDVTHYPTSFDNSDYYTDTSLTIKQLATSFNITNQAANETKELEWKDTFTYTTSYLPATSDYTNITWASSDDTIVSVDANGMITALAPGTVTITATLHNADNEGLDRNLNLTQTRTVKVPIPITSFTTALNPNRSTLYLGDSEYDHLDLVPTYNNGNSYEVPGNLTWTTTNSNLISIIEKNSQTHVATITALKKGTDNIHTKVNHYPTSFDDSVYETDTAITIKQLATSFEITNQAANETKELEWKDTFTYTTSYLPATSDYTNVTWASSDDTIVSVDANGTITAVAPGTVTITATLHNADNEGLERDLNFYETRTVKVPIPITSFTTALDPSRTTLYMGDPENEYDRAQLIPTYNGGSSYEVPGNLTWSLTNDLVTVTETSSQTHTAQIIAVSKGQETIHTKVDHYPTAFDDSVYETDTALTIKQLTTSFNITNQAANETKELEWKDTFTYTTSILPTTSDYTNVTWTSSDDTIVSVDASGTITAVSPGTVTITATLHNADNEGLDRNLNLTQTRTVNVPIPITSFTTALDPSRTTLYMGDPENEYDRAQLIPTYNNGNPYEVSGNITHTPENDHVTVTETSSQTHTAQIIAVSKGQETIHTKVDHYPTSFDDSVYETDTAITIKQLATSFEITNQAANETKELEWKDTFTYTTSYLPATSDYTNVTWASSDDTIVSVDANGTITAVAPGTVTITATLHNADNEGLERDLNFYETRTVKVPIPITTFTTALSPNRNTLYLGDPENEYDRAQLIPTYNNGSSYEVPGNITHTPANNHVTVTETDVETHEAQIIAVSKGQETIHTDVTHYPTSFDNSDYYTDTSLTIKQLATSFEITNQAANETKELEWKDTFTYTPSILPTTSDYTNITWTSSDDTIVSVDANGMITALSPGTVTITATLHNADNEGLDRNLNLTQTRTVKVPIPITTFTTSLSPNRSTLYLGDSEYDHLDIVPTYNNGDSYDIDGSLTWTPANGHVTVTEKTPITNQHIATIQAITKGQESINTKVNHYPSSFDDSVYETNTAITVKQLALSLEINNQSSSTTKNMKVGETFLYQTTISPDSSDYTNITWTSSDDTIVSVDASGTITAVAPGDAVITATLHNADNEGLDRNLNIELTRNVHVVKEISEFTLNPTNYTVYTNESLAGHTVQLQPTIGPVGYEETPHISWSSADEDIATVSQNGTVTGHNMGSTTVTGTLTIDDSTNVFTVTANITVETLIETFELESPSSVTLELGGSHHIVTEITPQITSESQAITWTTGDSNVATVTNGEVHAVGVGTTSITGTLISQVLGTTTITVDVSVMTSITRFELDVVSLETLIPGQSHQLVATIEPSSATNKQIEWSSSNPQVASVTDGLVVANTVGTATITATIRNATLNGDRSITIPVRVLRKIDSISVSPSNITLVYGTSEAEANLEATILPDNAEQDKTITWRSSDDSVVTVSQNGKITAVAKGTATITANLSNGMAATCEVTVFVPITTYEVTNGTEIELYKDQTHTIETRILPNDPSVSKVINWTSDDDTIATVSSNGTVTAVGFGTTTIRGTLEDDEEVTVSIKVIRPINNVTISQRTLTLDRGDSQNDHATLSLSIDPPEADGNKTVQWRSSDDTVATVDENGLVTAVGNGTATITGYIDNEYVQEEKSDSCEVTVVGIISSISILEGSEINVTKGRTVQLQTSIFPDNPTETPTLTWSSTDTSVATVNSYGVVTGKDRGDATIKVKVGNTQNAVEATILVHVIVPITRFSISPVDFDLLPNDTKELRVTITPSNTTELKNVSWSVEDPSIATVDENGVVTAQSLGETTITGTLPNGMSTTVTVHVTLTPRLTKRGDFNRDDTVNLNDVVVGLRKIFGYVPIETDDYAIGDLNGDGVINISDIYTLLRYVFGYIDSI